MSALTSAVAARPLANPYTFRLSVDRARRNRNTGRCAGPCLRAEALKSDKPRSWGKSVSQTVPWRKFAADLAGVSIKKKFGQREYFFGVVFCDAERRDRPQARSRPGGTWGWRRGRAGREWWGHATYETIWLNGDRFQVSDSQFAVNDDDKLLLIDEMIRSRGPST